MSISVCNNGQLRVDGGMSRTAAFDPKLTLLERSFRPEAAQSPWAANYMLLRSVPPKPFLAPVEGLYHRNPFPYPKPHLVHIYVAWSMCYCHIPLGGGLDNLARRLILGSSFGLSYRLIAGEEEK